jgi:hypothetical protein
MNTYQCFFVFKNGVKIARAAVSDAGTIQAASSFDARQQIAKQLCVDVTDVCAVRIREVE